MKHYTIVEYTHDFLKGFLKEGGLYIDATVGNGYDTEFLCRFAGKKGRVIGFDIQTLAIEKTKERLKQSGLLSACQLIKTGHENMNQYAGPSSVDAIVFNFGYLPGGDHALMTKKETSIRAIELGLSLLKPGGVMSLCVYSGKDTGFEEKEAILSYLKTVDQRQFVIIKSEFFNRPNNPPIPIFIVKQFE